MSLGGAGLLTRGVEGVLQLHPDFITWRLDLRNAYNEQSRRYVLDVLAASPSLAATILVPVCALETGARIWVRAEDGHVQGDVPSEKKNFFAMGLQQDLVALDEACRAGGGQARAGHDYVLAQGPAEVVISAVLRFIQFIKERCNLDVQLSKSHIFSWTPQLLKGSPEGVPLLRKLVEGRFEVGFDCYGVPMGSPEYKTSQLMKRAQEIVKDASTAHELLFSNQQAIWAALRYSIGQRFGYISKHSPPSLCEPVAAWLDNLLWQILESAVGFNIPR
jgi:hypothetical protein